MSDTPLGALYFGFIVATIFAIYLPVAFRRWAWHGRRSRRGFALGARARRGWTFAAMPSPGRSTRR